MKAKYFWTVGAGLPATGAGGAWIGRNAAERFLEAEDSEDIGGDILYDEMSRVVGSDRDAISGWLASATRCDYAAFARTVVSSTQRGSAAGQRLLREAASQVERMGVVLSERHGIHTLFVTGGLAESLIPRLASERFQLFPDATSAGALLGAAKWLNSSASSNFHGAQHG